MARSKYGLKSFLTLFKKEAKGQKFKLVHRKEALRGCRSDKTGCGCPMDIAFGPEGSNWVNAVSNGLISRETSDIILDAADNFTPESAAGKKLRKQLLKITGLAALLLMFSTGAFAWNCPTGQIRQQAPQGTPTTAPYYDVVEGIAFICVPANPSPTPSSSTQQQSQQQNQSTTNNLQNTSTNKNTSASNSTSSANSNSTSNSSSASSSSSKSAVNNSGNSSATGGNASAANNSQGNVSSYESSYQEVRQNPGAYAPTVYSTAPCSKGVSGGASTPSVAATFGIVLTDKGCDSRQTAVIFHGIGNDFAAAKILCSTDAAKRAHLTTDECLLVVAPPPVVVNTPAPAPTVIVVPTPTPVAAVIPQPTVEVPVLKQTSTLYDIGSCTMTNLHLTNVCKRMLDDAALRLENRPNARLVLTGPVESAQAAGFLRNRVSRSRIELRLADEQDYTLNIQLFEVN